MKIRTLALLPAMVAACTCVLAAAPDEHTLILDDDHGSYVDVAGKGVQITGAPISVQAWFKTRGRHAKIFESGAENRSPHQRQAGYALYVDFGGNVRFGVNNGFDRWTQERWDNATTRRPYNDGAWHHVTGVFPADGKNRVRIFIDSVEVPEEGLLRAGAPQPTLTRYLETTPPSRIGVLKGQLDELRVWKIALSARQIAENFRQRVPGDTPGLVAQWSFDPGEGRLDDAVGGHRGKRHKVPPPSKPAPPLPLEHDYSKYPGGLTGYTGYERDRIAHWTLKPAARQRLGTRGLHDPAVVKIADGTLVACAGTYDDPKAALRVFRSNDKAVTWTEVKTKRAIPSGRKPRMLCPKGARLLLRTGGGQVYRSLSAGVDWQEVNADAWPLPDTSQRDASIVRLDENNLIAAIFADGNAPIPGAAPPRGSPALPQARGDRTGEHSVLTESADGGTTWTHPRPFLGYSEIDAHLTKLEDGRLLCTYHNVHVPFGIMAIFSDDQGRTWDKEHPVFLARAWGPAGGRPSSVQLDDGTIVTVYSIQAYRGEGRDTVVESIRWELPPNDAHPRTITGVIPPGVTDFKMEPHDYGKYPAALYGYSGVNRQQVAYLTRRPAVRRTIGHRGLYKGALAKLKDGTLIATPAISRGSPWPFEVYRSTDGAASWQFVSSPGLAGKELGAAVLADGTLLNLNFYGKVVYRSTDGGRSWEYILAATKPASVTTGSSGILARNVIQNPDGSLIWIGGQTTYGDRNAPPSHAWRSVSRDGGRTWGEATEIPIRKDPEGMFDEAAMIRLSDGRLLAASRVTDSHLHGGKLPARPRPEHDGEDADHMVLAESSDDGFTWSEPRDFLNYSRVHAELVQLKDGRLLSCYAAYHLPLGIFAILSEDNGRTWSTDNPIQLAISTRVYTGWPTSVQLDDGSIVTVYATGPYLGKKDHTLAESVRWTLPPKTGAP